MKLTCASIQAQGSWIPCQLPQPQPTLTPTHAAVCTPHIPQHTHVLHVAAPHTTARLSRAFMPALAATYALLAARMPAGERPCRRNKPGSCRLLAVPPHLDSPLSLTSSARYSYRYSTPPPAPRPPLALVFRAHPRPTTGALTCPAWVAVPATKRRATCKPVLEKADARRPYTQQQHHI